MTSPERDNDMCHRSTQVLTATLQGTVGSVWHFRARNQCRVVHVHVAPCHWGYKMHSPAEVAGGDGWAYPACAWRGVGEPALFFFFPEQPSPQSRQIVDSYVCLSFRLLTEDGMVGTHLPSFL